MSHEPGRSFQPPDSQDGNQDEQQHNIVKENATPEKESQGNR
jgi:hypothetical protein